MRRREAGFTLLEVMVAFIIAALALGVLYKGALGGLLSARVATQYEDAISRARSRLATIGHGSTFVPGERSGDDGGGFRWRTRVAIAQSGPRPPGPIASGSQIPTLYAISVAITWGDGGPSRSVQLDTALLGFAGMTAP